MMTAASLKRFVTALVGCALLMLAPPLTTAASAAELTLSDAATCSAVVSGAWDGAGKICRTTRDGSIGGGSKVTIAAGVTWRIDHTIWIDGELVNKGTIQITYILDNYHLLTNEGTIVVLSGWLGNHEGQFGKGILTNAAGARIIVVSGAQVSNEHVGTKVGPQINNNGTIEVHYGAKFWNMTGTLTNEGRVELGGYMKTVSPGQVTNNLTGTFIISPGATFEMHSIEGGTWSRLFNKGLVDNSGHMDMSSGPMQNVPGGHIANQGQFVNRASGSINSEGSYIHNHPFGVFDNFGWVDVSDGHYLATSMGGSLGNGGVIYNKGTFYIGDGEIASGNGKVYLDCGGRFADGQITDAQPLDVCATAVVPAAQTLVVSRNQSVVLNPLDFENKKVPYSLQHIIPAVGAVSSYTSPITWTPSPGFLGTVKIHLRTTWHNTYRDVVLTVTVVNPNNLPPIAHPRQVTTPVGAAILLNLTATDPNGDILTYGMVKQPMRGQVTGALPHVIYRPAPGYSGIDIFQYFVSDGAAMASGVVAVNVAGNTPPVTVRPMGFPPPPTFLWMKQPFPVMWQGSAPLNGLASCDAPSSYAGGDIASTTLTGRCTDRAGNVGTGSLTFGYDATPPVISVTQPPANANGWYNSPVTLRAAGTDATSGIKGCSTFEIGTEGANQERVLQCTDRASNTATKSVRVSIDRTLPNVTAVASRAFDAPSGYNAPVQIRFVGTDSLSGIESCDAPIVYAGPASELVTLTGRCTDRAGLSQTATITFKYSVESEEEDSSPASNDGPLGGLQADPGYGVVANPASVAVSDVNNDGRQDLIAVNSYTGSGANVSVLLGDGAGAFVAAPSITIDSRRQLFAVAAADVDGDGNADLMISNENVDAINPMLRHNVSFLRGNGDGTFEAALDRPTFGVTPLATAAGDLDRDGRVDLVTTNFHSDTVSVLLNSGNSVFSTRLIEVGIQPTSVVIADVDRDGDSDLVVTHNETLALGVLLGNDDGTFSAETRYAAGGLSRSVTVADFNGDGYLDLATANHSNDVGVLTGNGDGSFNPATQWAAGLFPVMIVSGDFNRDGYLDVATANAESRDLTVLLGNGDATFQAPMRLPAGLWSTISEVLAVGDFDVNGGSDLAGAIYDAGQLVVWRGIQQ